MIIKDSDIELTSADVVKLAQAAGVNQPVMSVRVVGDRIELHLLGGAVALVSPDTATPRKAHETAHVQPDFTTGQDRTTVTQHIPPLDELQQMTVRQLHQVAADLGLSGYSRLKKDQLIAEIIEAND